MVGSKGEKIIRAMKLMRKSTVKKTTGPNCGQNGSATWFCRTVFERLCSPATLFLFATLRYPHPIRSGLQALQRTNPEANHKASSEPPQKVAQRKLCAAQGFQRMQKMILNCRRKNISGGRNQVRSENLSRWIVDWHNH